MNKLILTLVAIVAASAATAQTSITHELGLGQIKLTGETRKVNNDEHFNHGGGFAVIRHYQGRQNVAFQHQSRSNIKVRDMDGNLRPFSYGNKPKLDFLGYYDGFHEGKPVKIGHFREVGYTITDVNPTEYNMEGNDKCPVIQYKDQVEGDWSETGRDFYFIKFVSPLDKVLHS